MLRWMFVCWKYWTKDSRRRQETEFNPKTYHCPPFISQSWPGKSVWMCFCLPHKAGRPSYLSQVLFNSLSWLLEVNWLEVRRGRHVWGRSCDNGGIVKGKKMGGSGEKTGSVIQQGALRWWGWAVAPGLESPILETTLGSWQELPWKMGSKAPCETGLGLLAASSDWGLEPL